MEGKIVYFDNPGQENTEDTIRIAKLRAEELGIKTVVVASNTGSTAVKAAEALNGIKVVVVTHYTGMREPNTQELTEENRKKIESKGGAVLTATHALSGMDAAMRKTFNMHLAGEIIASTLRVFGQGMKVVCEIAMMAADAGLVRTDEDIIAIAGTRGGADTAVVLKPVNSRDFFELKVKEILCKPHF